MAVTKMGMLASVMFAGGVLTACGSSSDVSSQVMMVESWIVGLHRKERVLVLKADWRCMMQMP